MATTPLSQAILKGLDPSVYQPLQQMETGDALTQAGLDSSPTSKWGALGRVAQSLSGAYLGNSSRSKLADTIAEGKKAAQDLWINKQLAAAPSVPQPPSLRSMPAPAVQQRMPDQPRAEAPPAGSPAATVADRFPAEWSPPAPAQEAAPPAPTDGGPVAAINNAMQPRGIRNNNPLNIEAGDFTKGQPGFAGSDGRFAKFETPEHGVAAANKLLDVYEQKHGLNTVAGIVGRWAPSTDGNNTMAYAADVAGRLGIDPNAPVPKELRPQLIAAMAHHENGTAAPGTAEAPYKVAGPAVAAPPGGEAAESAPAQADPSEGLGVSQLLQVLHHPYASDEEKALASKLLVQKLTPKEDEFASSPQGIYNKRTGELKQGGAQSSFGNLQGPELMAAVKQSNPALASQAQAVLEGRVPYPSGSRLNPQQQQIRELVTQIDPNFTAANSKVMQDTLQDYGSKGRTGQARQAANTMLGHADTLDQLIPKLGNYTYGADLGVNKLHDFVAGNTDPEYQKNRGLFEETKKALAIEAEKALAGHTTVSGIKEHTENLNRAKSPEELRAAVSALVHILGSRLDAMASTFDSSMHSRTQGHEFLDSKGREIFNRFEGKNAQPSSDSGRIPQLEGAPSSPSQTSGTAAPAAPKQISTKAEYDALPSGSSYIAPDGSIRTKK